MDLEAAITAIGRARHLDHLSALLHEWRDDNGLAHLVYHAVHVPACARPNPVLLLTYDKAWIDRYVAQDYFQIDPLVTGGPRGFLPVDWMSIARDTPEIQNFFDDAERHGVGRHGITAPIRGPYGERALFTLTSNATDQHWHRWRQDHLRDFHLVGHHLHDRAMTLAELRPALARRPLSRREHQCLHLLARGRTPQQIADDLRVSTGAVHLYLRAARRKLDCATVEQAIAKAISFELVSYGVFN